MPRTPSLYGIGLFGRALVFALAVTALSAARGAADSPTDPPPAPAAVAPAGAVVPAGDEAKPDPEKRGEAQRYLDARSNYDEAQDLYRKHEYAHALAILDDAIGTLNWVITHADDRSVRTTAGDMLRRVASLRLACTRAVENERSQLYLVGPPSPEAQRVDPPAPTEAPGPTGSGLGPVDGATISAAEEAPAIETESNPRVQKWIDFYTGRGRGTFEMWLTRSGLYMDWMKTILKGEGLPTDLVHLVFVESGFNPQALSRSRAVGPWQFIRGTAKIFGLKVNSWVDERKDPERATQAAAHYLKHLYSVFDSWPLALASYNAGEGTVVRAIARQGTKDFWQLSLPRETRDYVPKFLACLHIARNPEQYGFDEVPRAEPLAFETVRIPGPVDLNAVASACKTTPEDLRRLNPQFLRFAAPNDPSGMVTIRVPQGSADTLIAGLGDGTLSLPTVSTPPDPAYVRHKVRRGETLARVARRYGVSASELARANGLRTKSRLHRGQSLRVPNPDPSAIASRSSVKARSSRSHTGGGAVYAGVRTVKIRRGDTLAVIANRHGTSVRTLRALNNLRPREAIRAGASIKVPVQS